MGDSYQVWFGGMWDQTELFPDHCLSFTLPFGVETLLHFIDTDKKMLHTMMCWSKSGNQFNQTVNGRKRAVRYHNVLKYWDT